MRSWMLVRLLWRTQQQEQSQLSGELWLAAFLQGVSMYGL